MGPDVMAAALTLNVEHPPLGVQPITPPLAQQSLRRLLVAMQDPLYSVQYTDPHMAGTLQPVQPCGLQPLFIFMQISGFVRSRGERLYI